MSPSPGTTWACTASTRPTTRPSSCRPTTRSGPRWSSAATRRRSSPRGSRSNTPSATTRIPTASGATASSGTTAGCSSASPCAHDTGLNLEDPAIHNGLCGTMVVKGDHFQVNGIPVVPVDDSRTWNPYQVAEITVKDAGTDAVLVQTSATVPTSDEINCAKCHGGRRVPRRPGEARRRDEGTTLAADRPGPLRVLPRQPGARARPGPGTSGYYLSQAIHGFHADKGAACYDCHPGATTKCSRSLAHTAADGNCTTCHGTLAGRGQLDRDRRPGAVGERAAVRDLPSPAWPRSTPGRRSIATPAGTAACPARPATAARTPWSRPRRLRTTTRPSSTRRPIAPIGDCKVCHSTSKGGGISDFNDAHGGTRATACSVCHTAAPSANASQWPHQFQWKSR